MRDKITTIIAFSLKAIVVFYLGKFAWMQYDNNLPFHKQHILVWLLIYLPAFAGYESILATVAGKRKKKSKNEII